MSSWDNYDLAEDKLKAFTRSAVRTKIMLCLKDKAMPASGLEAELGIRTSTILHAIKEMMEAGLIGKKAQNYLLTNTGKIQTLLIDETVSALVLLDRYEDFWAEHDLSGIPEDLLCKIGMLENSKVIIADPAQVLGVQEAFAAEVQKSKVIYGVSPINLPNYASAIVGAVENGASVELILTRRVIDIIFKEHHDQLKNLLALESFKLCRIEEEVKVAFTVTDSIFSLGLFNLAGVYDMASDLMGADDGAIEWGMQLFRYYRDRSELIQGT